MGYGRCCGRITSVLWTVMGYVALGRVLLKFCVWMEGGVGGEDGRKDGIFGDCRG